VKTTFLYSYFLHVEACSRRPPIASQSLWKALVPIYTLEERRRQFRSRRWSLSALMASRYRVARKTVVLPLAGCLGPSKFKFRYPLWALRRTEGISSSCASPQLSSASLRCCRRARGGEVQLHRLLYKSLGDRTVDRLGDAMVLAILIFVVALEGVGLVAGRRVDRAWFPLPSVFVGGELRSMIRGARGASLADVSSATSSFAAQIKVFVCRGFS
jgi:hypothetical protein